MVFAGYSTKWGNKAKNVWEAVLHSLMLGPSPGARVYRNHTIGWGGVNTGYESLYTLRESASESNIS